MMLASQPPGRQEHCLRSRYRYGYHIAQCAVSTHSPTPGGSGPPHPSPCSSPTRGYNATFEGAGTYYVRSP